VIIYEDNQVSLLGVRHTLTASWYADYGASVVKPPNTNSWLYIQYVCYLPIQIIPLRSSRFLTIGRRSQRNMAFAIPLWASVYGLLSGYYMM